MQKYGIIKVKVIFFLHGITHMHLHICMCSSFSFNTRYRDLEYSCYKWWCPDTHIHTNPHTHSNKVVINQEYTRNRKQNRKLCAFSFHYVGWYYFCSLSLALLAFFYYFCLESICISYNNTKNTREWKSVRERIRV